MGIWGGGGLHPAVLTCHPPSPDIVFFGESLPSRFFALLESVSGVWGALNCTHSLNFGGGGGC